MNPNQAKKPWVNFRYCKNQAKIERILIYFCYDGKSIFSSQSFAFMLKKFKCFQQFEKNRKSSFWRYLITVQVLFSVADFKKRENK